MSDERLFIVTYDIADQRRWRRVFKVMHGYGDWIQLSVFQCRLTRRRRAELETRLRELVKNGKTMSCWSTSVRPTGSSWPSRASARRSRRSSDARS